MRKQIFNSVTFGVETFVLDRSVVESNIKKVRFLQHTYDNKKMFIDLDDRHIMSQMVDTMCERRFIECIDQNPVNGDWEKWIYTYLIKDDCWLIDDFGRNIEELHKGDVIEYTPCTSDEDAVIELYQDID